jgi:hypothetical protein
MRGYKHVPAGAISQDNVIVAVAPTKTFNLAGIKASAVIIPDEELKKRYVQQLEINQVASLNVFAPIAMKTAYEKGDDYLEQLIDHLDGNIRYAKEYLNEHLPEAYVYTTEGTYFLWIDFNGTGLSADEIYRTVLEKAKVAGDIGEWFGHSGAGFIRLNPACPRSIVEEAVKRITGNKSLYLDLSLTAISGELSKSYNTASDKTDEKYIWHIYFSAPTGGEKYNSAYANATIDAKTGEIIGFNSSLRNSYYYQQNEITPPEVKYTEEECEKIFSDFVKSNIPEKFDFIKEEDMPTLVKRALKEGNPGYPVPKIMNAADCEAVIRTFMA